MNIKDLTITVAKGINLIFNPLLIPTYVVYFLLTGTSTIISHDLYMRIILGVIFIYTFLIPASLIPILYLGKFVNSFKFNKKEERNFLLIFTSLSFGFCNYLINRIEIPIPKSISTFVLASLVCTLFAIIINLRWKISLHMIGIGAASGTFLISILKYGAEYTFHFVASILIAGIIGTLRLFFGLHKPNQVFAGFLLRAILSSIFLVFL